MSVMRDGCENGSGWRAFWIVEKGNVACEIIMSNTDS